MASAAWDSTGSGGAFSGGFWLPRKGGPGRIKQAEDGYLRIWGVKGEGLG